MFRSPAHIDVTCEHGTATLWLRFPGRPVNALDIDRLRELDAALAAIKASPSIRVLVLRSGLPGGFCEGLHPDAIASLTTEAEAAAFAGFGQSVLDRLAALEIPTVAFIDGACLGAGLDLALACDYRLALASISAPLGFPEGISAFGGLSRLRSRAAGILRRGELLSAREAERLGFVHLAFCERRAKIELRSFLDRLERNPLKPRRRAVDREGFAAERREFAKHRPVPMARVDLDIPCDVVGFASDHPSLRSLAADLAVHGKRVVVRGLDAATGIDELHRRGFLTPLEADQARKRLAAVTSLDEFRGVRLAFAGNTEHAAALAEIVGAGCQIVVPELDSAALANVRFPQRIQALSSWLESPSDARVIHTRFTVFSSMLRTPTPPRPRVAA